jgi:hypothetical protein
MTLETPAKLYKYYAIKDFLPKVFNGESLKFSCPYDFNDPFESRACYHLENTQAGRRHIADMVSKRYANPSRRIAETQRLMNRFRKPQALDNDLAIESLIRSVGVCCLSGVRDSILMWSHYANEHKGVCIGFHTGTSHFKYSWEVIYQEEFPVVVRPKDSHQQVLEKTILTKAACWAYEKEWRIIKRTLTEQEKSLRQGKVHSLEDALLLAEEKGPSEYVFPKEAIAEICLGARIEKGDKEFVLNSIKAAGLEVPIFEVQRNPRLYQLQFVQLN